MNVEIQNPSVYMPKLRATPCKSLLLLDQMQAVVHSVSLGKSVSLSCFLRVSG